MLCTWPVGVVGPTTSLSNPFGQGTDLFRQRCDLLFHGSTLLDSVDGARFASDVDDVIGHLGLFVEGEITGCGHGDTDFGWKGFEPDRGED